MHNYLLCLLKLCELALVLFTLLLCVLWAMFLTCPSMCLPECPGILGLADQ